MLEIGSLVDGKYKILNEIGHGGMSVVYMAINEKANKTWAIKEVRKNGVLDYESVRQGLIVETDMLKKLKHKYLPSIVDVIDKDDSFLIVMDYIEGHALSVALQEYGSLPQEQVIDWAIQLCEVLGYLHSRTPAIIYRDMKPANIMLKPDGKIALIDFGTAREYKETNIADTRCLGTIGYAAPEQFGGMGQTDARTDIYCLGATLYHLVTGMNPCEPPYEILPIREINPALSGGFERIILKCTQRDPEDRYQSAEELMYALKHYDEIDEIYRRKQKGKLGVFLLTLFLSFMFAGVSAWGYTAAEGKRMENYDLMLANAIETEDYYEAMLLDPGRVEAYLGTDDFKGLIEYLIADGELTVEEGAMLTKLKTGLESTNTKGYSSAVDVLDILASENPAGYEQICYEIGEAYLFYYDIGVEKDKYAAAATWFQYAQNSYPIAKIYCDISSCLQDISKYKKAEQYAKLYEEYTSLWSKVKDLYMNAEAHDDDLRLLVWNELVNMINNNVMEFIEVSSQQELLEVLESISSNSSQINNSFLQDSIQKLKVNIENAKIKIQSVKVAKK